MKKGYLDLVKKGYLDSKKGGLESEKGGLRRGVKGAFEFGEERGFAGRGDVVNTIVLRSRDSTGG